MLLHLPIVFLATLSPIAVSDQVPKFDIVSECNHEGGGDAAVDRCSKDEATALRQLKTQWKQFGAYNKRTCVGESSGDGVASYVELLTCLEMTGDVEKENAQGAGTDSTPTRPGQSGVTVGVGHGPIRSKPMQ
jgi:hypothetical protein